MRDADEIDWATEYVSLPGKGGCWIAYPAYRRDQGDQDWRMAMNSGSGDTSDEALADAKAGYRRLGYA